jgi:Amt family ammonium transporter
MDPAAPPTAADVLFWVNNTWMLLAAFLVFVMHLGFATLETGSVRAKNAVNVLFKNVTVVAIGVLAYAAVGFKLMYPGPAFSGGWLAWSGLGIGTDLAGLGPSYADGHYTYWTDFLFQAMFAATAATIVSGAVAERIRLASFLLFSALYVTLVYPVAGYWLWGGGWLAELGFHDFAGSTIVHGVGGWAALAGATVLGPRIGAFSGAGLRGESPQLATIGTLLLWFGWYGFNGGSVLSAEPAAVSLVAVNTTLGGAAGMLAAMCASWMTAGRPDLFATLGGALAGLVGVTAGADLATPEAAAGIGAVAGLLMVLAQLALVRMRVDDPVAAVPVHLVGGMWGTLAVGLLPGGSMPAQLVGVGAVGLFSLASSAILFLTLQRTVGLRVTAEAELLGLDLHEHGAVPPPEPAPLPVHAK